ncbi:DUF2442 domain-containing protein [Thiohalocapsa sp. ML1]|jgi:hypothetical protein|uniref:DUF2442 domain-containing protein n=1 Tax=Thiohalocapsa sp. ML1 TaxID=1431688 RepID=UPI000731F62B|nr:DUF2442 domain-containing protein [Thiohalocapsa sp. ML1]
MNDPKIDIQSAEWEGEYRIRLHFDDGSRQTVDFLPFLSQSRHPDIRAFLDQRRFRAFRVEYGNLLWGDFDLCFPIMDLYRNRISHQAEGEAAA